MNITTLIIKIRELHLGFSNSGLPDPYEWSVVESWVQSYLASGPVEVQMEKLEGLDCSEKEIFKRVAQKAGCPIEFVPNSNFFKFVSQTL